MTRPSLDPTAPVVVGALGGSGTRVFGQMMLALGLHIGSNRNHAEDSLTASLLFNRPGHAEDLDTNIDRFDWISRLLLGTASVADRFAVLGAVGGVRHPPLRYRLRYALGSVRERGPAGGAHGWGFKEPNTHLFLPSLARAFANMRFIYVMRHPLDMAFSGNRQQLANWAPMFGIEVPDADDELPAAQLDLWLASTERALRIGPELCGDRFLAVDYEGLLDDPAAGVGPIRAHIGGDPTVTDADLAALVERPATAGRYQDEDLSQFRPDQLDAVREYGFVV